MVHMERGGGQEATCTEHLKKSVLKLAHDNFVSGHLGIAKTKERIKRHFFWPSLAADVENYVKACAICNRSKHLEENIKLQ